MSLISRRHLEPRLSKNIAENPLSTEEFAAWVNEKIPAGSKAGDPILVVTNLVESKTTSCSITHGTQGEFLVTKMFFGVLEKEAPFAFVDEYCMKFQADSHLLSIEGSVWTKKEGMEIPMLVPSLLSIDLERPLPEDQTREFWSRSAGLGIMDLHERKESVPDIYPLEIIVGHVAIQQFCIERGERFMSHYLAFWRAIDSFESLRSAELIKMEVDERENLARKMVSILEDVHLADDKLTKSVEQDKRDNNGECSVRSHRLIGQVIKGVQSLKPLLKTARLYRMDTMAHTLDFFVPGMSLDVPEMITELEDLIKEYESLAKE